MYLDDILAIGTRDVFLLKAFLLIHEVAAYFTSAPLYQRYQTEIIPFVCEFYAEVEAATLQVISCFFGCHWGLVGHH